MLRPVILPMLVPAAVPVAALPSIAPVANGGNGGGPPPPSGPAIYGNYTQPDDLFQQFGYITLDPGVYSVQIEVLDFVTSSFGSHEFLLTATDSSADFTDAQQQGLTGIYAGSSLAFYLGDPASAPNPQTASATLLLLSQAIVSLDGRFPMALDSARMVITFTLVPT